MKRRSGIVWLAGLMLLVWIWPKSVTGAPGSVATPTPTPRSAASPEIGSSAPQGRVRLGADGGPHYERNVDGAWERVEPRLRLEAPGHTEYVSEYGRMQVRLPARLGSSAIQVALTTGPSFASTPVESGDAEMQPSPPTDPQACRSVPRSSAQQPPVACTMVERPPEPPLSLAPKTSQAVLPAPVEVGWTPLRLALVDGAGREQTIGSAAPVQGAAREGVLTYANTFRGVTERFAVNAEGLKHEVILRSRAALPSTASGDRTRLDYQGLVTLSPHLALFANGARQDGDFTTTSGIELRDASGRPLLVLPPVYAYEQADPASRVDGYYAVRRTAEGLVLSFGVPYAWLIDPARQYPVILDPTIALFPPTADAHINGLFPSTNFGSDTSLLVSDSANALIRWSLSPVPARAMVDYSELVIRLKGASGPDAMISAHRVLADWEESAVTWTSRTGSSTWGAPGGDYDGALSTRVVNNVTDTLHAWAVTDLAAEWVSGYSPNNGVLLRNSTPGSSRVFASREDPSTWWVPELDIYYTQGPVTLTAYSPIARGVPSPDWYLAQAPLFWNAVAIRPPAGVDYDLSLSSTPGYTDTLAGSAYLAGQVDYVMIDANHAPAQNYFPRVYQFAGRGVYQVEHATRTTDLVGPGVYGPYTMTQSNVARVWDVGLSGGTTYYIGVRPISGDADLRIALHKSQAASAATWYQGRGDYVAFANDAGRGGAEFMSHAATENDWYGLIVANLGSTTDTSYLIYIDTSPPAGSFTINGGNPYANSASAMLNASAADAETSVKSMRFGNSPTLNTRVLVLQDSYPWSSDAVQQILAANDIPYDQLGSIDIPGVDLSPYSAIIIPSVQGDTFCSVYNANFSKFDTFVQNGGVLEVHGATQASHACRPMLPGGVVNNQAFQQYNYVVWPAHSLMAGVPNPFYGNDASHNSFTGYPANTVVLATTGAVPGGSATLIEYPYGSGRVLASGQTLEWGWAYGQDAGIILINMIPYAARYMPFAPAVNWLLPPSDGVKTVYGQFRNHAGAWSAVYTDTIVLDTQAPSSSASSPAAVTGGSIAVTWAAADALSGVGSAALWVKFGNGGTWASAGLTQPGAAGTFYYTPTTGSGVYYFATVATDHAGNVEAAPTGSGDDSTDYTAIYYVYTPLLLKDYVAYFDGPCEIEPNDTAATANGVLRSGVDYCGYPDDDKDYFSIYVRTPGPINVTLGNHTGGNVQLQLFYQVAGNVVAFDLAPPYALNYSGAAGWYYVYIFTGSNWNNTIPYTLRVTYP